MNCHALIGLLLTRDECPITWLVLRSIPLRTLVICSISVHSFPSCCVHAFLFYYKVPRFHSFRSISFSFPFFLVLSKQTSPSQTSRLNTVLVVKLGPFSQTWTFVTRPLITVTTITETVLDRLINGVGVGEGL